MQRACSILDANVERKTPLFGGLSGRSALSWPAIGLRLDNPFLFWSSLSRTIFKSIVSRSLQRAEYSLSLCTNTGAITGSYCVRIRRIVKSPIWLLEARTTNHCFEIYLRIYWHSAEPLSHSEPLGELLQTERVQEIASADYRAMNTLSGECLAQRHVNLMFTASVLFFVSVVSCFRRTKLKA